MSNGNGLKAQWDVNEPAQAGSDKQSQQFQKSFKASLTVINGHLQYTSANAEAAKHGNLKSRREGLNTAFQSALSKIDPSNPAKAQRAIDKVLADAKALDGEVKKLHTEAEKGFNDWQERQPKLDSAIQQVEELEAWEDTKAPTLRKLVDGVRKETDKRRYASAGSTLDQLLPKLQPIHDDYLRQKEAKEKYEPALAALQSRLGHTSQSGYPKLESIQKDITDLQGKMEAAAQRKDFVQALNLVDGLPAKLEAFEGGKSYEDALATLQPRLSEALPSKSAGSLKIEPQQESLIAVHEEMKAAAQGGDYEVALRLANDLPDKLDEYEAAVAELEQEKLAYEESSALLQPRLAGQTCHSENAGLTPMQEGIVAMEEQIKTSAQSEDYVQALSLVKDLSSALDAYESAEKENEIYEIEYPPGTGKKYYGTAKELVELKLKLTLEGIKKVLGPLKNSATCNEDWYNDLKSQAETGTGYVFYAVIYTASLGDASLEPVAAAVAAQRQALDDLTNAISSNPEGAQAAYEAAVAAINATGKAIGDYVDAIDSGGNVTITTLKVVEVVSFSVAAALGAAVLAPAGAGLLATAGANALAGAGFGALQSVAENAIAPAVGGDADKINLREVVEKAALAAVLSGAGSALGSAAGKGASVVAEGVMVRLGFKEVATRLVVKDIVNGGFNGAISTTVQKTPDLVTGKTSWEEFWEAVALGFIAGGIAATIAGKMSRNSPLFKGLKDEEIDAAFKEAKPDYVKGATNEEIDAAVNVVGKSGTGLKLPGQNPTTGEGLQDIKIKFDPNKPIGHHDNMEFEGIKDAPSGKVEVRRHSANPNAPEGSYSRDNPTTQINVGKKYRLPDGTFKKFKDMTPEEKAAAHIE